MQNMTCGGAGKFAVGLFAGMVAGTAIGMTMAPSHRQLKRAAHQAAQKLNKAVENLTDAIDL